MRCPILHKATITLCLAFCMMVGLFANNKSHITIAVFSLNDFHSAFLRDDSKGIPGAAAILQTLDSLKSVYPYHITVAAGDNFGGSYFDQTTNGALMPLFMKEMGISLSAVGNHEFDKGQDFLRSKWADSPLRPTSWDIQYVCANVRTVDGNTPDFARPFEIQSISLPSGQKINIAFIGMITSATPWQASKSKLKGLSFDGRYDLVLDSLQLTPSYNSVAAADARILLTHIGTSMSNEATVWTDKDTPALQRILRKDWDGILTAHTHEKVCGYINNKQYPVVQGGWHGEHISLLKFTFDTLAHRVISVQPELCPVHPHAQLSAKAKRMEHIIDSLLQVTTTPGGSPIGEVLTELPRSIQHDRTQLLSTTEMGTLVCSSYAEAVRQELGLSDRDVVIGVSHFGSIRAGFSKGKIRVLDVGEALPFANAIKVYRLTGEQLLRLFRFGEEHTPLGIMQYANVKAIKSTQGDIERLIYISPKGEQIPLNEQQSYLLAADEYMTFGGDGYSTDLFPEEAEVKVEHLPTTTDAFIRFLKNHPF